MEKELLERLREQAENWKYFYSSFFKKKLNIDAIPFSALLGDLSHQKNPRLVIVSKAIPIHKIFLKFAEVSKLTASEYSDGYIDDVMQFHRRIDLFASSQKGKSWYSILVEADLFDHNLAFNFLQNENGKSSLKKEITLRMILEKHPYRGWINLKEEILLQFLCFWLEGQRSVSPVACIGSSDVHNHVPVMSCDQDFLRIGNIDLDHDLSIFLPKGVISKPQYFY